MNCSHGLHPAALTALLALVAPVPAHAAEPPLPRKLVTIEGITEYQLDNGLRILLHPDKSTPNVTVNLTVLVGSRHEGYGETGMAHLLEHMVFKGTPAHPDVPKALRDHGARFNGTTWVDRTNYFETMPATDDNLEFALRLEADRLVNSHVRREDLASEMTVVRNEFEAGENDPQSILSQRMLAVAFEWHNYGKSTIGNRSDIERVPIDRLQGFYRKHYQPDNAVLVVAGNFDESKALRFIGKYFGALKRPERTLETTYTEEPPQDGERTVILRRVGKVGVVGAVYHIPAGSHEDFAAVEVLATMLSTPPSGRLYQALVTSKKANSVSVDAAGWHDPGVLEILAEVNASGSLEDVRDTITSVVEKLAAGKIDKEEVERAKTRLLKNRELLMTDTNRIGVVLSDWAAKGDWRLFFLHRDRLEKVTPADVARVAGQYLRRSNRTVGMYIPTALADRAPVPLRPNVAALVKEYRGRATVAAGESFDPTPENIEARVRRSELPGGMKLALLPKKSRGEQVVVELTLRYGNEESLRGLIPAAQLLPPLMARGTAKHTRQQLEDELDRLKARLRPSAFPVAGEASFTLECRRSTLPQALALLQEVLRQPSFPQEEFDVLKRQRRDMFAKSLTDPYMLAMRTGQRKLNPYPPDDVRYIPTLDEAISRLDKVTVADVRRLYDEQVGAAAGEVVVVGDFDPEPVTRQIGDMLRDWKAVTSYRRIEQQAHLEVPGQQMVVEVPDKANAVYYAALTVAMKDSDPDYPAVDVATYVFGGGSLSSRLGDRVRQKEGLSYGVGAQFHADAQDRVGRFGMVAICNPENMARLDRVIAEELERMLREGVGVKELEEAKKAYLQELKVNRATDAQLASLLQQELEAGRTLAYQADLEKKIAALTPEQVATAFRKHIAAKRLVIIHAGSLKK